MAPRGASRSWPTRARAGSTDSCRRLSCRRRAARPTVALLGDLSFLYDVGAVLWNASRDVDLTIVVVNNGGGEVFSLLPARTARAPELFVTPHGLDLRGLRGRRRRPRAGRTRVGYPTGAGPGGRRRRPPGSWRSSTPSSASGAAPSCRKRSTWPCGRRTHRAVDIELATSDDVDALARLAGSSRRAGGELEPADAYRERFVAFAREALATDRWHAWVARVRPGRSARGQAPHDRPDARAGEGRRTDRLSDERVPRPGAPDGGSGRGCPSRPSTGAARSASRA